MTAGLRLKRHRFFVRVHDRFLMVGLFNASGQRQRNNKGGWDLFLLRRLTKARSIPNVRRMRQICMRFGSSGSPRSVAQARESAFSSERKNAPRFQACTGGNSGEENLIPPFRRATVELSMRSPFTKIA